MEIKRYIKFEIQHFVQKMNDIYSTLLNFNDSRDDTKDKFEKLIKAFEKHKILEKEGEIILLFQLISKISDNHHQTSNFYDKLEKIFRYLIKDAPSSISKFIADYTNYNKRLLFFLLEKKIN